MNLNDDSYTYIRQVADQIEGLTCALIIFIENAGCELESYHYEAFNKFSNEIRGMEIAVSKEIKEEFIEVKEAIEESAIRIRASESSIGHLRSQLSETEDVFSRLVIHSENIREFRSDTSNPFVPNASDEVYRAFSGYNKFLGQYQVSAPVDEDPICSLMYSFFCTVSSLFERLFAEYDSLLQNFGVDVEEKRKNLAALSVIKKHEGKQDIAKAALGVAKVAAFAALGIKKKNAFDVVASGVGLLAKVNDTLEDLDKLKYVKPKKSIARNVLKGIATYNDAMELVGGGADIGDAGLEAADIDFEVPTLAKLAIALSVALGAAKSLNKMKDSGAFDIAVASLGIVESGVKFASTIVSGKGAFEVVKKLPDLGSNALGLVEKTAKYINKKNQQNPALVEKKNKILNKLGAQLKNYNDEVEKYKIAKERKLMAVKKPKAPPFIIAKDIVDMLKNGIDKYKEGSDLVEDIKGLL